MSFYLTIFFSTKQQDSKQKKPPKTTPADKKSHAVRFYRQTVKQQLYFSQKYPHY